MPSWLTRITPLLLAILIGALIWALNRATELPPEQRKLAATLPDLIAQDAQVYRYDPQGRLVSYLTAKEARHLPQDDTMLFESPLLEQTKPGAPKLTLTGEQAKTVRRAAEVWLYGKVEMRRAASGKDAELVIRTRDMHVNTETQVARSKAPVAAEMGLNRVNAVGFVADNRKETLELLSQVRMTYVPKKRADGTRPRLLP